ncbi:hypothetical protein K443DRAFT_3879 [Laccaria amethystina LaAM-08-1]|uniref:SWIM-type domain-containing protein n=1 Tax=Laccaria amethystina LaAM-08-1 TaxID=1095629 RepID=A0A0C9YBB4_9AGAR|nr:hypothetical protein K443DRAFT_3879 [Laccaria amethystina LaAM-08-1]
MSQQYWRRDDLQLPSAEKLLADFGDDVDVFNPQEVPNGVEILCWGMKKIAEPLKGHCVEVGLDATYNTNSRHLELYSVMAEHDNAGFPLSYCLLSTATAIDLGKRTKALMSWTRCLKDKYGVNPKFVHVDKDMAEIAMAKVVWDAKISLCWWHLQRAVRTRLANGKLSTTPYNVARKADPNEFEGGAHADADSSKQASATTTTAASSSTTTLPHIISESAAKPTGSLAPTPRVTFILPQSTNPTPTAASKPALTNSMNTLRIRVPAQKISRVQPAMSTAPGKENRIDLSALVKTNSGTKKKLTIRLLPPQKQSPIESITSNESEAADKRAQSDEESEEEELAKRRTFCPMIHRDTIINMMEKHYCAHPLIPGYAPPSPEGIRHWAVRQMYNYCFKNELPEVWAYLWENWYRKGRWELWARSTHPMIPILKTTMILESHWRCIKHDFLHHFHMPRCDLLVWILVVKLAPTCYRKLNRLLTETGRYRELPSWRKGFKREWRKLEKTPITMPINDAYRPDAKKMVCTCPYLATSRFLICKHLVQSVHPVPPVFFLEAKRHRNAPFWRHLGLKPIDDSNIVEAEGGLQTERRDEEAAAAASPGEDIPSDDDDDDDLLDMGSKTAQTFEESMKEKIDILREFLGGLEYQIQFRDGRMLQALERDGAALFRMAKACLSKERRMQSTRGEIPSTWEQSTSSAMFYRSRPARSDSNTHMHARS